MITITEIRKIGHSRFFEVYSENGSEFIAKESYLEQNGIVTGAEFSEEEFELIRAKAQLIYAIRKCLDFLEQKDYSRKELYKKLTERGISEDIAEAAVGYAAEHGYQDDRRYAKRLAELAFSSYGKRRVEQILYTHGIEREIIREVMEEFRSVPEEEDEKIDRLLTKAAQGKDLRDPAIRKKLYAKLTRLGYDSAAILAAFTRYSNSREDGTF